MEYSFKSTPHTRDIELQVFPDGRCYSLGINEAGEIVYILCYANGTYRATPPNGPTWNRIVSAYREWREKIDSEESADTAWRNAVIRNMDCVRACNASAKARAESGFRAWSRYADPLPATETEKLFRSIDSASAALDRAHSIADEAPAPESAPPAPVNSAPATTLAASPVTPASEARRGNAAYRFRRTTCEHGRWRGGVVFLSSRCRLAWGCINLRRLRVRRTSLATFSKSCARINNIANHAEACARSLQPGMQWLGGLGEARAAGFTNPRDQSLFCHIYLSSLPPHARVVCDRDNNFIRFE